MRYATVFSVPGVSLTKRQRFRPVPLLVAALLLALAAQTNLARGAAVEGALWYVLAGVALLRALAQSAPVPAFRLVTRPFPHLSGIRKLALAGGLLAAATAGWLLGAGTALSAWLSLFIAGFVVATVAADLPHSPALIPQTGSEGARASRKVWLAALMAVTLLGLALRVIGLDAQPLGIWYDEANIGLEAVRIINEPDFRPLYSNGATSPAAYLYLVSGAVAAFGQNAVALRLVSALAGAATVPVFALLLREFGGVRLALAGAFLMAVCRWDITFSRLAMQGVTTPLFACLTLWLLVSGLRRGSAVRLILAGSVLGVGLLFYTAFLLFPAVVALAIVSLCWQQPKLLRDTAPGLLLLVLAFAAAAMPFISFAIHHQHELLNRPATASMLRATPPEQLPGVLLQSAGQHVGMFQFRGDANGRHNLPGAPMLDPVTGMLAALGLALALNSLLTPLHALVLAWLLAGLLPGVLSLPFEAPQGLRAIGAVPPVLALAALGTDTLARLAGNALGPRRLRLWAAGMAVILLAIGGINYYVYFWVQARDFVAWAAHSTDQTIIGYRLRELPPDRYDVLVSGLYFQHLSTAFLKPDGYPLQHFDLASGLPLMSRKEAAVVFLEPRDHAAVEWIQRLYPDARCQRVTVSPAHAETLMETCVVSRAAIERTSGLEVRYQETQAGSEATGVAPGLAMTWSGEEPVGTPFRAFWAGALHAPEAGVYGLRATGTVGLQVRLDGLAVLDGPSEATARVDLARGLHQIAASAAADAAEGTVMLEWQRPGAGWEPVPATALFRPPVAPAGLTGSYFPNPDWKGTPVMRRVDWGIGYYWHLTPLPRPYSVEWTGSLRAPVTGRYRLGLRAASAATLTVNGREVLAVGAPVGEQSVDVELTAGLNPIRVRYLDQDNYSHIYLTWTPPGGGPETVPVEALRPW